MLKTIRYKHIEIQVLWVNRPSRIVLSVLFISEYYFVQKYFDPFHFQKSGFQNQCKITTNRMTVNM
jgi:hypothetical protein